MAGGELCSKLDLTGLAERLGATGDVVGASQLIGSVCLASKMSGGDLCRRLDVSALVDPLIREGHPGVGLLVGAVSEANKRLGAELCEKIDVAALAASLSTKQFSAEKDIAVEGVSKANPRVGRELRATLTSLSKPLSADH